MALYGMGHSNSIWLHTSCSCTIALPERQLPELTGWELRYWSTDSYRNLQPDRRHYRSVSKFGNENIRNGQTSGILNEHDHTGLEGTTLLGSFRKREARTTDAETECCPHPIAIAVVLCTIQGSTAGRVLVYMYAFTECFLALVGASRLITPWSIVMPQGLSFIRDIRPV